MYARICVVNLLQILIAPGHVLIIVLFRVLVPEMKLFCRFVTTQFAGIIYYI